MSVNIKLLKDRTLVKIEKVANDKTASGLYIPETAQTKINQTKGTVEAVGPGKIGEPMTVKVGDRIEFESYSGKMSYLGVEYYVIKEASIIAII